MKLTTIIASTLGVGLLSLTSFAVAQDKYAARFPIKGVDANPTFGMTESEKQEYLSNVEMCANEALGYVSNADANSGVQTGSFYGYGHINTGVGLEKRHDKYAIKINGNTLKSGGMNIGNYSSDYNTQIQEIIDNNNLQYNGYPIRVGAYRPDLTISVVGWSTFVLELEYYKESENYQWCKDNGFKTAN